MTWQEIWNNYVNLDPGVLEICLRLLCAMVVGSLIGIEREYTHRPAGFRTHILVALGACVVSVTGELIFTHYAAMGATPDPARLSAQVITGVGFLGAGTIMKEGVSVKGLTTAASVWAVACLGIAAGFGYYALALLGMVFTFITLTIFEYLQKKLINTRSAEEHFVLHTQNLDGVFALLNKAAADVKATIFDLDATKIEDGYRITFRAWFTGRKNAQRRIVFFGKLAADENVRYVSYKDDAEVKI